MTRKITLHFGLSYIMITEYKPKIQKNRVVAIFDNNDSGRKKFLEYIAEIPLKDYLGGTP